MNEPIRYESIQEPLDDEERELMDPETWDWDHAEERPPVPNAGAVLRVRFSRDEIIALDQIAREAGLGPVEFVRRTMLQRIATDPRAQIANGTPHAASA